MAVILTSFALIGVYVGSVAAAGCKYSILLKDD